MRKVALGLLLMGFVGTAAAGDYDFADARYADGNDYAARLYYRFDFGGAPGHAQSVGLRFDNERMAAHGAPALFQASYSGGVPQLKLQGLELVGPSMVVGQLKDVPLIGNFTIPQLIGIVFTAVTFITIGIEATDSGDAPLTGTGS